MKDNTNLQRNAKIIKGSTRLKVYLDLKPIQFFGITSNSYDLTASSPRLRIKENTHQKIKMLVPQLQVQNPGNEREKKYYNININKTVNMNILRVFKPLVLPTGVTKATKLNFRNFTAVEEV